MQFLRLLIISALFFSGQVQATDKPPAAAIASAQPLATAAGATIIRQGGNAFDAAVAITAALGVVEPYGSGLGGGAFWLLHIADEDKQVMIDGREMAPALAHKRMYQDDQGNVIKGASVNGPLAAGIPGIPAGLVFLAGQYGKLPLKESLKPAIRYAGKGFAVTERYRKLAAARQQTFLNYPEAAAIFLDNNGIPEIGHRIVQKDLARTLEIIADKGRDGFYTGELAEQMVFDVRLNGGIWSMQDLAGYKLVVRPPVVTSYRGVRIVSASPPSSGGVVMAQALNILENFDVQAMANGQRKHYVIEALRRAFRDRAVYLGDPDYDNVPVTRLLDRQYTSGLALSIDADKATPSAVLSDTPGLDQAGAHTTHFSVIDREGNRVAGTLSINLMFGSGFVPRGTGVLLNNEMDDFSSKRNTPNSYGLVGHGANTIQPGKRPLSSMSPTFLETADRIGILGTPGGSRIISMVLLATLDFVDGGLPASWVSLPRYHHQYLPDLVIFEKEAFNQEELNVLRKYGHKLRSSGRQYGNMQAILWDKKANKVFAASDPRGEGEARVIDSVKQR